MKPLVILSAHCEPLPTSAAAHMCDIGAHFNKNRRVYFLTQSRTALGSQETYGTVYGLRNPFIKSSNNFLRLIGELIFPILLSAVFGLWIRLFVGKYDVLAYSPTALQFPLMYSLRKKGVRQLLIVRDIFPEWLAEAGLVATDSIEFKLLKYLSEFQYQISDVIAVQAEEDISKLDRKFRDKCVVLHSFYSDNNAVLKLPSRSLPQTVNIGCMGTFGRAQAWRSAIIILNRVLLRNINVKLHLYGSNNPELNKECFDRSVQSRIIIGEPLIGNEFELKIMSMDIGIFSLNPEITSANIPGKFVTYCKYGIPVFGLGDPNSVIAGIIENNALGKFEDVRDTAKSVRNLEELIMGLSSIDPECLRSYFNRNHSVSSAGDRIIKLLSSDELV